MQKIRETKIYIMNKEVYIEFFDIGKHITIPLFEFKVLLEKEEKKYDEIVKKHNLLLCYGYLNKKSYWVLLTREMIRDETYLIKSSEIVKDVLKLEMKEKYGKKMF